MPSGQQELGLVPLGLPGSAHGVWWEDWTTGQQAGLRGVGWNGEGGAGGGISRTVNHDSRSWHSVKPEGKNQGGS